MIKFEPQNSQKIEKSRNYHPTIRV